MSIIEKITVNFVFMFVINALSFMPMILMLSTNVFTIGPLRPVSVMNIL